MSFQVEIDKAIKEKRLYFIGDALPVDWYAGFKLWLAHAEAGDAKAQYNVGRCYNRGDGIEQDKDKALYWYLKAADQNDPKALFNLYLFHSNDKNKDFNPEKSEQYLKKAIDLNEPRALDVIEDRKRAAFFKEGESIKQQVQELLDSKNFEQAEGLLDEAIVKGYKWATTALAGIKVELTDFFITNKMSTAWVDSNYVRDGNTVGGGNLTTKRINYHVFAKNKTDFETNIQFAFTKYDSGRETFQEGWQIIKLKPQDDIKINLNSGKQKVDLHNYYIIDILHDHEAYPKKFKNSLIENNIINFLKVPLKDSIKFIDNRSHCFVLTACFNNPNHSVVIKFRRFRDEYLMNYRVGIRLVRFYYEYGPRAAKFIEKKEYIKKPLRYLFSVASKLLP